MDFDSHLINKWYGFYADGIITKDDFNRRIRLYIQEILNSTISDMAIIDEPLSPTLRDNITAAVRSKLEAYNTLASYLNSSYGLEAMVRIDNNVLLNEIYKQLSTTLEE